VKWVHKNKRAPLAVMESTQVKNSPAVELPPSSFDDPDLKVRQSRLTSPARTRRMIFWRSKSKSTSEKSAEKQEISDRNNNSKSVDQPDVEYRTITTARIITRPTVELDPNGNNVTPRTERGKGFFGEFVLKAPKHFDTLSPFAFLQGIKGNVSFGSFAIGSPLLCAKYNQITLFVRGSSAQLVNLISCARTQRMGIGILN
jgi:hypothetical protein